MVNYSPKACLVCDMEAVSCTTAGEIETKISEDSESL